MTEYYGIGADPIEGDTPEYHEEYYEDMIKKKYVFLGWTKHLNKIKKNFSDISKRELDKYKDVLPTQAVTQLYTYRSIDSSDRILLVFDSAYPDNYQGKCIIGIKPRHHYQPNYSKHGSHILKLEWVNNGKLIEYPEKVYKYNAWGITRIKKKSVKAFIENSIKIHSLGKEVNEMPIENNINDKYKKLLDEGRVEFITFHPSYSYEEFIEGITINPNSEKNNEIEYMYKDGIFKRFCARALACALNEKNYKEYGLDPDSFDAMNEKKLNWNKVYEKYKNKSKKNEVDWNKICDDKKKRFLLIIDEINRGDISKIFGELITLLENDKRLGGEEEKVLRLTYSSQEFCVPPNVYIVGTMNTADRSIAMLDTALRRRFGFIGMYPDEKALQLLKNKFEINEDDNSPLVKSIDKLDEINKKIRSPENKLSRDKMIGQSFFYQVKDKEDVEGILCTWQYEIFPLLEEYCWGSEELLVNIVGKNIVLEDASQLLNRESSAIKEWLGIVN